VRTKYDIYVFITSKQIDHWNIHKKNSKTNW
jgi:hypothetical protein